MDFRKKIGIFVLAGAIVLAGFLLFSPSQESGLKNNQVGAVNPTAEPFQLGKDNEKLGVIDPGVLLGLNAGQKTTTNLTQQLADSFAQGFMEENPSNVDLQKGLKAPKEEFVWSQFIQQIQDNDLFDQESLEVKEVNIGSDNSQEKVKDYFLALVGIFQNYRSQNLVSLTKSLEAFAESQDPNYLLPVLNFYDQLTKRLKELKVPSDWVALHLELINLIGTEREIFASFSNYQVDPLRAVVALESLSSLSERELNLFLKMGDKLEKEGLAEYLNKELKGLTIL